MITNGKKIEVTNENRFSYIYRMVHYRLNVEIREESKAFLKGLNQLIPQQWLQIFDENELLYIICGSEQMIDIDDLKKFTHLSGYSENDKTIQYFWEIVKEFDSKQRRELCKFITSSPRAPLLGFKDLNPPLTIKKTSDQDIDRLPTTSTCINLLKLPPYQSKKSLKEKLIMAIEQGNTSFELT